MQFIITKNSQKQGPFFLLLFFSLAWNGCSSFQKSHSYKVGAPLENASETYQKPYVILISIDGYRFDYTDLYHPPHLKQFRDEGVAAEALLPVFPSSTFTNHMSIITGMYPENHGIVANHFFDPLRNLAYARNKTGEDGSWYLAPPLWITAQKQGMLTATFFWPASAAEIQGIKPTYYYRYDGSISNATRTQQVLNWLNMPAHKRPHFITLYFSDVDATGHQYAPGAPEVRQAIAHIDKTIGDLLSELKKLPLPIYTFIVSDHGMEGVDFSKILFLEDYVNLDGVQTFCDGPFAYLYSNDKSKLKEIQKTLKGQNLPWEVYLNSEIPKPSENRRECPRCGDLQIRVPAPYNISLLSLKGDFVPKGVHGYDVKQAPSMKGIFYAQGPGLKKQYKMKPFENIHIYPLILKLLELKPLEPVDGKFNVLKEILLNP